MRTANPPTGSAPSTRCGSPTRPRATVSSSSTPQARTTTPPSPPTRAAAWSKSPSSTRTTMRHSTVSSPCSHASPSTLPLAPRTSWPLTGTPVVLERSRSTGHSPGMRPPTRRPRCGQLRPAPTELWWPGPTLTTPSPSRRPLPPPRPVEPPAPRLAPLSASSPVSPLARPTPSPSPSRTRWAPAPHPSLRTRSPSASKAALGPPSPEAGDSTASTKPTSPWTGSTPPGTEATV